MLVILYKSALPTDRVLQLFRERAEQYLGVAGLQQKLNVHDPATGEVGGIYLFDSKTHLDAFCGSDLAKSTERVYRFTAPPTIRTLDVVQAVDARHVEH